MVLADRPADTSEPREFRIVGTRPIRPDGVDKVTGRAQYAADVSPSGMIFGRILRSPHAHAVIKSIDVSKARELPGVKAIITGADFPEAEDRRAELGESTSTIRDLVHNVMAKDKVLYRGHPVAAVAATTSHIAEEALALIIVDYDVLTPVLDVRKAMEPESPVLHPAMRTKSQAGPGESPTNIASHTRFAVGDVEAGFAESDIVIEREFTTQMVHQGYIEPQSSTAMWSMDGNITVWTSTQGTFAIRDQVANAVAVKPFKVKVIPMEIGGGFGGKIPTYTDPIAALLSKHSGVPVKVTLSRIDVFEATGPTSGSYIKLKMGISNEGKILAAKWFLAYEAGAFAGSPVAMGAICASAPYVIPNVIIDAYDVVVNKPKVSAYRAPGAPQGTFASESIIDEFALKLGMDPMELRRKNASSQGDRLPSGLPITYKIGNIDVMQAAIHSPHYQSPVPESTASKKRGRGVSMGYWPGAPLKSSVYCTVNPDGSVSLIEGSPDIGGSRASLAMQLAEVLGIPYENVKPQVVDTDTVGYNDVTGGSRVTFASGLAVIEAGNELIKQIKERATKVWGLSPEDAQNVEYKDGAVVGPEEGQRYTFAEAAAKLTRGNTPLIGRATVAPKNAGMSFGCHICDVEVDVETGKVDILRYTAIQDAGKAIHPSYVEGQMQGGAAQGIGWALNEEYVYDDNGRMLNSNFLDYRMATSLDLPMIETIVVEVPHPGHPYGVRGVGETPIVPPLAATANAVSRALDHRFTHLPISPRRIVEETLGI